MSTPFVKTTLGRTTQEYLQLRLKTLEMAERTGNMQSLLELEAAMDALVAKDLIARGSATDVAPAPVEPAANDAAAEPAANDAAVEPAANDAAVEPAKDDVCVDPAVDNAAAYPVADDSAVEPAKDDE